MLHSSGSTEYLIFRNMYLVCTIGKDALFVNNTAAMYVAIFICYNAPLQRTVIFSHIADAH